MAYVTIIRQGLMVIFQNNFEAESDDDALYIHAKNIVACEQDITEDWDTAFLIAVDEYGNILRFVE